jgi:DNA repair protein RadC
VDGSVKGIGEAKAVTLLAALELGRRAAVEEERRDDLAARLAFWTQSLSADEREFLVAIYLDGKDRPISDERLSYGGVDGALLDAGYLMRRAVRLDCASLVLLHNHPDGDTEPSGEDMQLTRGVARMLDTLQIGFYGHYIVGGGHIRRIPDDSGGEDEISAAASPNRGNK